MDGWLTKEMSSWAGQRAFGGAWPQVTRPRTDLIGSVLFASKTPNTCPATGWMCSQPTRMCPSLMSPPLGRLALLTLLCNALPQAMALRPNHSLSEAGGYFLFIFVSLDLSVENYKVLQTCWKTQCTPSIIRLFKVRLTSVVLTPLT